MQVSAQQEYATLLTDYDTGLLKGGRHYRLYEKLGAHAMKHGDATGTYFAVWAPNARYVAVVGNFNGWNRGSHQMNVRWDSSGVWEIFIPGIGKGTVYKYYIESHTGYSVEKADPYASHCETPPATASIVWDAEFEWTDQGWMKNRSWQHKAMSVYEVHCGSWRRKDHNAFLTYRELAEELPAYCVSMGFTHVELMPVMEHPFYGSWGYQVTGYFAPTSRYGTPEDFMHLVNELHRAGIGVILDWVPSHFPSDEHGLVYFDGTHLYEHPDPRKGKQQDWDSMIFNYGRNEVRAFLISNALFWMDRYHADGLRVDAVASMLYLDYSRKHGEWEPNEYGGRENLEAMRFLQDLNEAVRTWYPDALMIAEESTAWPGVTADVGSGGLGFTHKWMMGWMHDTLFYFQRQPVHRSWHQGVITFSIVYAFSEKFVLPLSHDEVVHGKGSLINKMPGDEWQQFANLRLLYAYMFGHPGGKLLFMGGEFGQRSEWKHDNSLDWHLLQYHPHETLQKLIRDLNTLYKQQPALHELDLSPDGFEWIDFNDSHNSVIGWMRKNINNGERVLLIANCTPVPRTNYRMGVPVRGTYTEIFNSDSVEYGGSGVKNGTSIRTYPVPKHGRTHSVVLTLPPLGLIVLKQVD